MLCLLMIAMMFEDKELSGGCCGGEEDMEGAEEVQMLVMRQQDCRSGEDCIGLKLRLCGGRIILMCLTQCL